MAGTHFNLDRRTQFCVLPSVVVVSCIAAASGISSASGDEWTAEELKAGLLAAIESVQTIEGRYETYFRVKKLPGAEITADGLTLFFDFDWLLDRARALERLEGRVGNEIEGRMRYGSLLLAWDGKEMVTYMGDQKSGMKLASPDEHFAVYRSPLVLMGRTILGTGSDRRDLQDVLDDVELIGRSRSGEGVYGIRSVFRNYLGTEDTADYEALVWVDTTHGFVPRKFEIRNLQTQTRARLVEAEWIEEVAEGIWLPTKGSDTSYRLEPIFPDAQTETAYRTLKGDELVKLQQTLKFRAVPLGYGTEMYVVDTTALKVNEPIPTERFSFHFPPGSKYFDEVTGTLVQVPLRPVTTRAWFWITLLLVNAFAVLLFIFYKRRQYR